MRQLGASVQVAGLCVIHPQSATSISQPERAQWIFDVSTVFVCPETDTFRHVSLFCL
jgi:hypothetical protein